MLDFYSLSKSFNCDTVQFQRLLNWGTFTTEQFAELDVCNPDSPLYRDVLNFVRQVAGYPDAYFWHGMPKVA